MPNYEAHVGIIRNPIRASILPDSHYRDCLNTPVLLLLVIRT
jgi:hypothetical protein